MLVLLTVASNWGWASGLNDNSALQSTCLKYLQPKKIFKMGGVRTLETKPIKFVTETEYERSVREPFAVKIYKHPFLEPLFFLEPPDFKYLDESETADAIRYAEYLKKRGQGFLFISVFRKFSVPSFDGVVFDLKTGEPLFNVQLKHSNPLFRALTVDELNASVSGWAKTTLDPQVLSPEDWFAAVNHFNRPSQVARLGNDAEVGIDNFIRFETLAYVFGLFPEQGVQTRPLWLVRDLSDFGMTYDMLTSDKYRPSFENALNLVSHDGLTMFWNGDQVLEYPPHAPNRPSRY